MSVKAPEPIKKKEEPVETAELKTEIKKDAPVEQKKTELQSNDKK